MKILETIWNGIVFIPEKIWGGAKAVGAATKNVAVGTKDKIVDVFD
jgi:hypothetical protein